MLIILAGAMVSAQKITGQSPSSQRPIQSQASSSPPPKTERKSATTLRSSETQKGSRLALRSNEVLNDYSAYRIGDRFYVVIPKAEAPATKQLPPASGRGFDNMQVQKRGSDLVLSFRLQPGTSARVNQKFNKLDVFFETPAASSVSTSNNKALAIENKLSNSAAEREAAATADNAPFATTSTPEKEADEADTPQPFDSTPATVEQTPTEAARIAQVEQRPVAPVAAPSKPSSSNPSPGTMLTSNWFPVLILAILVLTCVGLIWFTRPRQRSTAPALGVIDSRLAIKEEPSSAKRLPDEASPQENEKEHTQTREENALSWAAAMSFVPRMTREPAVESPDTFTLPQESLIEADERRAEDRTDESSGAVDSSPMVAVEVRGESVEESSMEEGTTGEEQPHVAVVSEPETERPDSYASQLSSETASAEADDQAERSAKESVQSWRAVDEKSLPEIIAAFNDPSEEVRNGAAHALYDLNSDRVGSFTRVLREAAPESRRQIGAAFASSGLADDCISQLSGASPVSAIEAFSLLFLMVKAGEIQPLLRAIEEHPNSEVRMAVIKLLALSEQRELLPDLRRLVQHKSLPTAVRSALMQTIYQISSQG